MYDIKNNLELYEIWYIFWGYIKMREFRDNLLGIWRGLPVWVRREMRRMCRSGWVYSGMTEVGWSWSCSNGGVGFEEDLLKEGMEGEMIPSEPMDYMGYIRGLLGGEINFRSEKRGEVIWIGVEVSGEWIWGSGLDREEAFLRLVGEVGEWYWVERCPGLGDISRGSIVDVDSGADLNCEIEIREVDGEMEITFMDFYTARMFIGKWDRFILDSGFGVMGGDRFYHGKMRMVEGEVLIYSMPANNNYVATAYGVGGGVGSSMGNIQISVPNFSLGGYGGMADPNCWQSKEYKDLVDMIRDKNYSGYKH